MNLAPRMDTGQIRAVLTCEIVTLENSLTSITLDMSNSGGPGDTDGEDTMWRASADSVLQLIIAASKSLQKIVLKLDSDD